MGLQQHNFFPLARSLKQMFNACLIDFPSFGKSSEPTKVWTLDDYKHIVLQVINKEKLQNITIISHSFGTRVALKMANCYNHIDKIVITGGAGLKRKKGVKVWFKIVFYKLAKKWLNQNKVGSSDYKALSQNMKKTFVNIVNTCQTQDAKNIKCPVLLIYGKRDFETPLYIAKKFNKLIKNSKLKIYEKCGHFCFLEKAESFFDDVLNFINGDCNGIFSN